MKLGDIYKEVLNESKLVSKSDKGNRIFKQLQTAKFQHYDMPKGELSNFIKGEEDRKRLVSKLGKEDKKTYREWLKTPEGEKSIKLFNDYASDRHKSNISEEDFNHASVEDFSNSSNGYTGNRGYTGDVIPEVELSEDMYNPPLPKDDYNADSAGDFSNDGGVFTGTHGQFK